MDGLPEINRNQPAITDSAARAATNVLPPPTEVKIRTMKSDLAGLAASGGGMPRYENVVVRGLSIEGGNASPDAGAPRTTRPVQSVQSSQPAKNNQAITMIVITVIALIVLGVLIYFGYQILK